MKGREEGKKGCGRCHLREVDALDLGLRVALEVRPLELGIEPEALPPRALAPRAAGALLGLRARGGRDLEDLRSAPRVRRARRGKHREGRGRRGGEGGEGERVVRVRWDATLGRERVRCHEGWRGSSSSGPSRTKSAARPLLARRRPDATRRRCGERWTARSAARPTYDSIPANPVGRQPHARRALSARSAACPTQNADPRRTPIEHPPGCPTDPRHRAPDRATAARRAPVGRVPPRSPSPRRTCASSRSPCRQRTARPGS